MSQILLVDDDPMTLEFMRLFFKWEGRAVVTASCGLEFHEILRSHRPDVMLTDINLPDVSGVTLARLAREAGIKQVVGVTGYDPSYVREHFDCRDFNLIVPKPVDLAHVSQHLEAASAWSV